MKKRSSNPEVGIFWIDRSGAMYAAGVSLRSAQPYDDYLTFDGGHCDSWGAAVRANPQWKGLEYEQVPRGRVVYQTTPKKSGFIVYMPRTIAKQRNKVISRFRLSGRRVRFDYSDEHYQQQAAGSEP